MKRIIYLLSTILLGSVSALAQGTVFSYLQGNPDVRTSALGGVHLGKTDRMYIYTNPAALLSSDKHFNIDLSTESFPKSDEGSLMQYNLGAGYKITDHHAILMGFRYSGGLSFSLSGLDGSTTPQTISPFEWAADLGYVYKINAKWALHGTGSYISSYLNQSASAYLFSIGVGYHTPTTVLDKSTELTLGARLSDVGPAFKYSGSDKTYSTPMAIEAGGDVHILLAPKHDVAWLLGAKYIVPQAAAQAHVGTGIEYTYDQMISVRLGYRYSSKIGSYMGLGLGARFYGVKLDAGYNMAIGSETYGANTLMIGVGYDF